MNTTLKDEINRKETSLLVSIAKIHNKNRQLFRNKKGDEYLVPEYLIYIIFAVIGLVLLIYIIIKMAEYA